MEQHTGIPGLGLLPPNAGALEKELENMSASDQPAQEAESDQQPALDAAPKPQLDPDFLAAATANKGNQNAEWQFDSSDAESSDTDSDTSSDTSDEDSDEEDYPLLDAAEQARILMQEEYGDEDGAKGSGEPLRSANEQVEEKVEKPNVTVTPDMKITELGVIENVVDNLVLIRAKTSGEYQVLESGSVLCLSDRSVIGAVAETLGRVQEPLYSVAFNSREEIAEAGITKGTTIYYVDQHSTYVFTQALQAVKGSDASNQFDEEAGAHEVEFSDDEAEAEHKRQLKQKKRGAHEGQNDGRGNSRAGRGGGANQPQPYTGALSYDDDEGDMYTPLARPDNLHQMMGPGGAPLEHVRAHRGRGGFRGRMRGRGDSRHNAGPKPNSNAQTQSHAPGAQITPHQQPSFQFNNPQAFGWPQNSAAPFAFAGIPSNSSPASVPAATNGSFPAGAFVNPSFYQGQQQQPAYVTGQGPQTQQWPIPPPQQAAQFFQLFQAMAAANQPSNGHPQQTGQSGPTAQSAQEVAEILRTLSNNGNNHDARQS